MQTDLIDGVKHLIQKDHANASNVCIAGASYGGYAALMGAILHDDIYKCAVSINGVTDLRAYLEHKADLYGRRSDVVDAVETMIGFETKDKENLAAISPLSRTAEINIPLLVIHGKSDRVVPLSQAEDLITTLRNSGQPTRFLQLDGVNHNLGGYDPSVDDTGRGRRLVLRL